MKSYAPALVAVLPLVAGCALIQGGSGSFTADGDTYKVSKVECTRAGDTVTVTAESGAAGAELIVRGTEVVQLRMGSKQRATMAAEPADGQGTATVTVEGLRYRATGKLMRLDDKGQAPEGPGTEEVTFDVTCGKIAG